MSAGRIEPKTYPSCWDESAADNRAAFVWRCCDASGKHAHMWRSSSLTVSTRWRSISSTWNGNPMPVGPPNTSTGLYHLSVVDMSRFFNTPELITWGSRASAAPPAAVLLPSLSCMMSVNT
jgi:hypothetical protein